MDVEITLAGEQLLLLPERAVYWLRRRTLLIADPHFGKAAAFRAAGIPTPEGGTADNLARLDAALVRAGASRLVCLGDWLHAASGRAPGVMAALESWRAARPALEITLVRGNHDRHAGDPPSTWDIACLDEPVADPPFIWRHQPAPAAGGYPLAGHVHPAVALRGPGGQSLSLPCFYFGPRSGILPAFGDFTGTALIAPEPGARVYVLVGEEIVEK